MKPTTHSQTPSSLHAELRPLIAGPAQLAILAALSILMAATRFHAIGAALHLPDASMAVFFLGGLYLQRHRLFAGLLAAAVAIDYIAITGRGMDFFQHYCVTPSYAFLLLAYAVLWYLGRAWAPSMSARPRAMLGALAVALAAAAASFLISNGAFYWFGGRYLDPNFAEYLQRVWRWGPLFVGTTMAYIGAALLAHALIARFARPRGDAAQRHG
ncbi:hypothetical protein ABIE09_002757 [Lysobacter enzymogenes]|jgi:hypothetical protein|uniref:hypothetical protein n=1 Tax=Lysobacter enzymogenes TaxID=69 RepID=UPI0008969BC2|nr:hypothetical protein [Lysobacter enzymogenes]SDW28782.1 hypothetical protein SAMN05421681_101618 [Lysobacter enzymogenes]